MARQQTWQDHTRQAKSAQKRFFDKIKQVAETKDIKGLAEAVANAQRKTYLRNVLNPPSREEQIKDLKRKAKQRGKS